MFAFLFLCDIFQKNFISPFLRNLDLKTENYTEFMDSKSD